MRRLVFVLSSAVLAFSCLPAAAQEQAAPQTAPSAWPSWCNRRSYGWHAAFGTESKAIPQPSKRQPRSAGRHRRSTESLMPTREESGKSGH